MIQRLNKLEAAIRLPLQIDSVAGQQRSEISANDLIDQTRSTFGSKSPAADFTPQTQLSSKRDYGIHQEDNTDGLAAVTAFSDEEDELESGESPYYGT